jgi:DNA-binding LytR/AlgR family response regulator
MIRRTSYLHSVCAGPQSGADPIPVDEVIYFRTDGRSTVVVTGKGEHRISTPLSELLALLDPEKFPQVHGSLVVNRDWIEKIKQEGENCLVLTLRQRQERLTVNQPYCRQFREHQAKVKRTAAI